MASGPGTAVHDNQAPHGRGSLRRALSPARAAQPGRNERGVAGRGRGARPTSRREDPRAGGRPRAFRPRGEGRCGPLAPEHLRALRLRRGGGQALHGAGVPHGRLARRPTRARPPTRRRRDHPHRRRRGRGSRARPQPRPRAPRPEAGEHPPRRGAAAEDRRLRHRAGPGERHADRVGNRPRNGVLHLARTGLRRRRDAGQRRLLARSHPLPAADGPAAVRIAERDGSRPPASRRAAARRARPAPRRAGVAGRPHGARAGEGPGRAPARRRRVRGRSRRRGRGRHTGAARAPGPPSAASSRAIARRRPAASRSRRRRGRPCHPRPLVAFSDSARQSDSALGDSRTDRPFHDGPDNSADNHRADDNGADDGAHDDGTLHDRADDDRSGHTQRSARLESRWSSGRRRCGGRACAAP